MGGERSNLERLLDGGVINPEIEEIPVPYLRFVEGLTRKEVDLLIAMRQRLQAADEWQMAVDPESPIDAVALLRPPY